MKAQSLLDAHRAVNQLLKKLVLGLDQQSLNREIISLTEKLFGERKASILMLDDDRLYVEYAPHLPGFYNQAINGLPIGEDVGSCGAAAFSKKPVVVSDVYGHANWNNYLEMADKVQFKACWSFPILASSEKVLGTFALYNDEIGNPKPEEMEIIEMLASLYAVALEKYQLESQLRFHASRDPLTHCLNRRVLLQEAEYHLSNAQCSQCVIGCFFVDIDKFKQINDRFGHEVGDKVLVEVAKILNHNFNNDSVIGRYGGDEFVGFSCFHDVSELENFYAQLKRNLNQHNIIEGYQVQVSVGYHHEALSKALDLDSLIKAADLSMYKVKQTKRPKCDIDHGVSIPS